MQQYGKLPKGCADTLVFIIVILFGFVMAYFWGGKVPW